MATIRRIVAWTLTGQLPVRLRAWRALRRDAARIAASGLFDAAWYRARYPDIAAGTDLALHYNRLGAAEGRSPGPRFDGPAYLAQHREAMLEDANPLLHFLDHGRADPPPPPDHDAMPALPLTDANYRYWLGPVPPPCDPPAAPVLAVGEHVVFVPPFMRLRRDAPALLADALRADPGIDVLYADQDRIDAAGNHFAPIFKPAWDPDWMAEHDLIGWAAAFRRDLVRDADADEPWQAARRIAAAGGRVAHLPQVLFHALPEAPPPRVAPPSPAVLPAPPPLVSLIVPTRDRAALLARCAAGVLQQTDYPAIELIVVDNDSREARTARLFARLLDDPRVRILPYAGAFNWSAMNNAAAEAARGEVLVLLNNDIEVIDAGWLRELVALVLRPEVGVAGAKLIYPDGGVQHAGMTLAGHSFGSHVGRHAARDDPGHGGMLAARRRVSAVTGACLAIRRAVYRQVGGIEEQALHVTASDVDLCLRVRAQGLAVLCTPHALLYHREAATRGLDATTADRARVAAERAYLLHRWGDAALTEDFLSPNLTVVRERLALAPRSV